MSIPSESYRFGFSGSLIEMSSLDFSCLLDDLAASSFCGGSMYFVSKSRNVSSKLYLRLVPDLAHFIEQKGENTAFVMGFEQRTQC